MTEPSRLKWTSFAAALVLRTKCEEEECGRKDLLRKYGSARGSAKSEEAIAANDYKKKKKAIISKRYKVGKRFHYISSYNLLLGRVFHVSNLFGLLGL